MGKQITTARTKSAIHLNKYLSITLGDLTHTCPAFIQNEQYTVKDLKMQSIILGWNKEQRHG